jgi:hypothetical protein
MRSGAAGRPRPVRNFHVSQKSRRSVRSGAAELKRYRLRTRSHPRPCPARCPSRSASRRPDRSSAEMFRDLLDRPGCQRDHRITVLPAQPSLSRLLGRKFASRLTIHIFVAHPMAYVQALPPGVQQRSRSRHDFQSRLAGLTFQAPEHRALRLLVPIHSERANRVPQANSRRQVRSAQFPACSG